MHELSLISDLLNKMESVVKGINAKRITGVKVRIGALSHISAEHFREHFIERTKGTLAEGAGVDIEQSRDITDPQAQDILLVSVDVEE